MPSWFLLPLFIFGCTLVPPLFVLGGTMSPRLALTAWWFFARYLLVLAVPAIMVALVLFAEG